MAAATSAVVAGHTPDIVVVGGGSKCAEVEDDDGDGSAESAMDISTVEPEEEHSRRQPSLDRSSGRTVITVPGEIEDEDESPLDHDDSSIAASSESRAGWVNNTSKRGRRAQASTEGPLSQQQQLALSATGKQALDFASKPRNQQPTRAQFARKVNASMAKAAKMPNFAPRDEIKVVVRPRGGLMVGKTKPMGLMSAIIKAAGIEISAAAEDTTSPNVAQNIMVVSTPDEERAKRYERVRAIAMGDQIFEVFAYRAAPENTAKGVIRNIGIDESPEEVRSRIVHKYNPTALDAHRIGKSEAVIVLFDGDKVPSYIKYGNVVVRCYLYRQHREVCKTCGQVGHRKDVCPTPTARVCFACGKQNPGQNHQDVCKPRCKLCGGPHATGTKNCKNKFKTPFQVKKRQWKRALEEEKARANVAAQQPPPSALKVRISSREDFPELIPRGTKGRSESSRSRSPTGTSRVASRDRQRSKSRDGVTSPWASVAAGGSANRAAAAVAGARQRSKSTTRSKSRSRSWHGNRNPTDTSATSEIQQLRKMVREQQEVIAKLSKQLEELLISGPREKKTPTAAMPTTDPPSPELGKMSRPQSRTPQQSQQQQQQQQQRLTQANQVKPKDSNQQQRQQRQPQPQPQQKQGKQGSPTPAKRRAEEAAEPQEEEAEEAPDMEEEDGDESTISSISTQETSEARAPGYAGLNIRLRQITNRLNRWEIRWEELEKRLGDRLTRQFADRLDKQFADLSRQIEQSMNSENMKTFILGVVGSHFNTGTIQPIPPTCQETTAPIQA